MKLFAPCVIICVTMLTCWQILVSVFALPPYILPSPLNVFAALIQQHHLILMQAIPTTIEILLGFLLGITFGSLAGILTAFYHRLSLWFLPLLIVSQAIPTFAIAPLLVIWLGYGITSKIATTILMIFFPIASSMYDGLRQTPGHFLDLAKTMQASKWRTFMHVRIPAALPHLASGIRIAAVVAPIGAIVGEWVGSSRGLGYLMLNANARMQIDVMFAVLIVIIMMSLTLYFLTDKLLQKIVWWKGE